MEGEGRASPWFALAGSRLGRCGSGADGPKSATLGGGGERWRWGEGGSYFYFIWAHLRLRQDAKELKAAGDEEEPDSSGDGSLRREGAMTARHPTEQHMENKETYKN